MLTTQKIKKLIEETTKIPARRWSKQRNVAQVDKNSPALLYFIDSKNGEELWVEHDVLRDREIISFVFDNRIITKTIYSK